MGFMVKRNNAREKIEKTASLFGKTDVFAATAIIDAKTQIRKAKEEGKNVRLAEELLKRAERAYKDKNYDKSLGYAKACLYKIEPKSKEMGNLEQDNEKDTEKEVQKTISTPHWLDRGKIAKRGYIILFFNSLVFGLVGLAIYNVGQLYHALFVYIISFSLLLLGIYSRRKLRQEYNGWVSKCFDTDVESAVEGIEKIIKDMNMNYKITGRIEKAVLPFLKRVVYAQSIRIYDGTEVRIMELPVGVSIYVGPAGVDNLETVENLKYRLDNAYLGKRKKDGR